jgi:hypothetical protein
MVENARRVEEESMAVAPTGRPFFRDTSWDDLGWTEYEGGVRTSSFILGDPNDPDAPVVFKTYFPPGCRVNAHHHTTDYAEIILEGSQQVTGKWHTAGDVRVVHGGIGYGPLIAGPEGVHVVVIFRNQDWPARGLKPLETV